jgi:hypothetical protein
LSSSRITADYVVKLSNADRDLPEWQAAGEALIMAAEIAPTNQRFERFG